MVTNERQAVEALTQETKPGRTRERPVKHDFYEWVVCVAELDNWRCEVPELQVSIKLSHGFLRLTEASCCVNLGFLAFGSSEKDDPCTEPSF